MLLPACRINQIGGGIGGWWSSTSRSGLFTTYQGVSHAEWPKDKYEYATIKTGRVTWPVTAVGIECAPPRPTGLSQRERKL
jgi:hypothetical protein